MWLNNRLNSNLLASCVVKYVHINILMYMLEDSMNCDMCYVCYVGSSFALLVPFSVCVFKRPSSCSVDNTAIVQLWCSLHGLVFLSRIHPLLHRWSTMEGRGLRFKHTLKFRISEFLSSYLRIAGGWTFCRSSFGSCLWSAGRPRASHP